MNRPVSMAVRQRSPEWYEARRAMVTSTDIPVLLGISPYLCEADLADEKRGIIEREEKLRMAVGRAVQPLIGAEYARITGRRVMPVTGMWRHPEIEWAGASPDFRVIGEKRLVEAKRSNSRKRFHDEETGKPTVPEDVEAQCVWAMGVGLYPVSDVAVLQGDDELLTPVPEVRFNQRLFDNLVTIGDDFLRRLAAGGPFSRDLARVKRDNPADDGTELDASAVPSLEELVQEQLAIRAQKAALEKRDELLERDVRALVGPAAKVIGSTWQLNLKQTKERVTTDWKSLADGFLNRMPTDERETLVGLYVSVAEGSRPYRLTLRKES